MFPIPIKYEYRFNDEYYQFTPNIAPLSYDLNQTQIPETNSNEMIATDNIKVTTSTHAPTFILRNHSTRTTIMLDIKLGEIRRMQVTV